MILRISIFRHLINKGFRFSTMKTIALLVIILSVSLPTFAVTKKQKYVGYKHKGVVKGALLPNGVKDNGGGLTANENFGVSHFSKGRRDMLWLEKITARDKNGVPDWEVKDVLTFKKLKKNQEFLMSFSSPCTLDNKQNLDLIVKAQLLPDKKTYKVLDAWTANVKKGKFEDVSKKTVKCVVG